MPSTIARGGKLLNQSSSLLRLKTLHCCTAEDLADWSMEGRIAKEQTLEALSNGLDDEYWARTTYC